LQFGVRLASLRPLHQANNRSAERPVPGEEDIPMGPDTVLIKVRVVAYIPMEF